MGKKSKLVEFWTQKLVQIRACVISTRKTNILTSKPFLHTLMQTLLSANQRVRNILVIL